jgi:hypothetical protein
MRSNKNKAKRRAAAKVSGTMFEHIGTSKAWNPQQYGEFKYRASGKVGRAASNVRKVEITPEESAKYLQSTGDRK